MFNKLGKIALVDKYLSNWVVQPRGSWGWYVAPPWVVWIWFRGQLVHLDFSLDEHLFKESAKTNDECPWKRGREFLCSSIHHPEKGLHKIMGKTPLWGCVRETYIIPQKPYLNLKCGGETEKLIPSLKLTVSLHLKSWMVGIRSFPFGWFTMPCLHGGLFGLDIGA